jgi:hypothetical protein
MRHGRRLRAQPAIRLTSVPGGRGDGPSLPEVKLSLSAGLGGKPCSPEPIRSFRELARAHVLPGQARR